MLWKSFSVFVSCKMKIFLVLKTHEMQAQPLKPLINHPKIHTVKKEQPSPPTIPLWNHRQPTHKPTPKPPPTTQKKPPTTLKTITKLWNHRQPPKKIHQATTNQHKSESEIQKEKKPMKARLETPKVAWTQSSYQNLIGVREWERWVAFAIGSDQDLGQEIENWWWSRWWVTLKKGGIAGGCQTAG